MPSPAAPNRLPQPALKGMGTALLTSLLVSGLGIGARQLGWLQPLELLAIDHLTRWQPAQPPDPRLLIVEVTQADINTYGKTDQVFSQLINKLQPMRPRVIGLDINASIAFEPGRAALLEDLRVNKNIVAVCGRGSNNDSFAPPPGTTPEQVGFADVVRDPDFVIRRNLLTIPLDLNAPPACRSAESLGLRLAMYYLSQQGITGQRTSQDQLQIGKVQFPTLASSWGGYQNLDNRGEQIFLQYRSPNIAQKVTLKQVLESKVPVSQVKDRIILIGITAKSGKDFFISPLSIGNGGQEMAGVEIHAQATSQILSAVLDSKPLVWVWPVGVDWLWIWGWGAAGTLLAGWLKRPLWGVALAIFGWASLTGVSFLLFTQAGWVPLVPAALALGGGIVAAIVTQAHLGKLPAAASEPTSRQTSGAKTSAPVGSFADPAATAATNVSQKPAPSLSLLQGRYQLIEQLSYGGFGVTHLAKDTKRPKQPICVVKQLKMNAADQTALRMAREFFHREAQTLEELGDHEQIPRLLAYFEEEAEFYLVQDYIAGMVLNQTIGSGVALPEAEVIAILKDVLPILDFIHGRGVIHRDIKPANLIRRDLDQRIVLIDFGAVKQSQSTVGFHPSTVILGTLGYAAPEQLAGRPEFRSDLYGLGMVALQALGGLSVTDLQEIGAPDSQWPATLIIRESLAAILAKMTQYFPQNRYSSARDVLKALEQLA
jgi:CHASE2 domain-containing sensor protein